jgi:two-component system, OmpR family, KDP operon response regulator KdpE
MSAAEPLVLVIEDEQEIRRFLRATLAVRGYRLIEAATGEEGLQLAAAHVPDLILLDLGLPDIDGLTVTRRLREWSTVPILVLTARGLERDKIAALDSGADDYVTKPFGIGELAARMRVALRHAARAAQPGPEPVFEVGELSVDLARRRVVMAGQEVHLTPIEYRLFVCLVGHAGRVVTHKQLAVEVWGQEADEQRQYVRIYMRQIRNKLEATPARPRYLLTESGVGYRLVDE